MGADGFQGIQGLDPVLDRTAFGGQAFLGALEGPAVFPAEEVELLDHRQVVFGVEPVALGVAPGFEVLGELIGPETHKGGILPEQRGGLADGVVQFLHIC